MSDGSTAPAISAFFGAQPSRQPCAHYHDQLDQLASLNRRLILAGNHGNMFLSWTHRSATCYAPICWPNINLRRNGVSLLAGADLMEQPSAHIVFDDDEIRVVWQPGGADFVLITFGDLITHVDGNRFFADIPADKAGIPCLAACRT